MTVIDFAYAVDAEIARISGGRLRSSFSRTQRAIADQLVVDHHAVGSDVVETARIVWSNLKTLES